MSNPFGIPDEVLDVFVKAAVKQNMEKSRTPENPFKVDPAEMAKKSASTAKQLFDAYVKAGFTKEQAFELVKGIVTTKNIKT